MEDSTGAGAVIHTLKWCCTMFLYRAKNKKKEGKNPSLSINIDFKYMDDNDSIVIRFFYVTIIVLLLLAIKFLLLLT